MTVCKSLLNEFVQSANEDKQSIQACWKAPIQAAAGMNVVSQKTQTDDKKLNMWKK